MKLFTIAIFSALLAVSHAAELPATDLPGSPTGRPTGSLKPGEYWWNEHLSPSGPVVVLVSIPLQVLHVYRNGVLVGRSTVTVSSSAAATSGGVYTVIQRTQPQSKNAAAPTTQRLTSSGITGHVADMPGTPASKGSLRMPHDFAQLLYGLTSRSATTIVVGNGKTPSAHLASDPGVLLAPTDFTAPNVAPLEPGKYDWHPNRREEGPISIVISSADRALYVFRNGNAIGRAAVQISGSAGLGSHVFTLLSKTTGKASRLAPDREAARWMCVTSRGPSVDAKDIAARLHFSPDFAHKLYDTLSTGATIVVTDLPLVRKNADAPVFQNQRRTWPSEKR
ncbi:MAG TPA: L,D-transpeptidase family protein [Chthoniobacter sp.]|nr:L,D-transpeptidase family protein [Chthoniobacter sp.]